MVWIVEFSKGERDGDTTHATKKVEAPTLRAALDLVEWELIQAGFHIDLIGAEP